MLPQKQIVDLQLEGLDTGTDPKMVLPGKMLTLYNASFRTKGRIEKRPGHANVDTTGGTIYRLYGLGSKLLKARLDTYEMLQSYNANVSPSTNSHGPMALPELYIDNVLGGIESNPRTLANTSEQWSVDAQRLNDSVVIFAANKVAGVEVAWVSTANGQPIVTYQTGLTNLASVRVIVAGTKIAIAGVDTGTGNLKIYEITSTTTNTLRFTSVAATAALAIPDYGGVWDVAVNNAGTFIGVAYLNNGVANVYYEAITVSSWAVANANWAAGANPHAVAISGYTDFNVFWDDDTGLRTRTYTTGVVNTLGTTTVVAGAADRRPITSVTRSDGICDLCWNDVAAPAGLGPAHGRIEYVQVSTAGAASGAVTTRGVALGSKLHRTSGGRLYVLGFHGSTKTEPAVVLGGTFALERQRCGFVLEPNRSQAIRGRFLYGQANKVPHHNQANAGAEILPNFFQYGSSANNIATATQRRDFESSDGQSSGALVRCSLDTSIGWHAAELDRHLLITGGYLQSFDGAVHRESGFFVAPAIQQWAVGAGGALADGTYGALVVYERFDAQGYLVESITSPVVSIVVAGGGGTRAFTIDVTTYRTGIDTTAKERVSLYLTQPNGTAFNLHSSVVNDRSVDTVQFLPTTVATITANKLVYTTGGEEDAAQPDCPVAITAERGRAWVVQGNNRLVVDPSRPSSGQRAPSFYLDAGKTVSSEGGPVVALTRMDEKTFAHKARHTHCCPGEGPDLRGDGDTRGEFEAISLSVGATDQRSVLVGNMGIYLRGERGIWLIGHDLQASYVGEDVASTNATAHLDACRVAKHDELCWPLADNTELVFHERARTWAINATPYIAAETIVAGVKHILSARTGNHICRQSETDCTDEQLIPAGSSGGYALQFRIGWVKLGGIAGYGRIWEVRLLGNSPIGGAPTLTAAVYYDFEDVPTQGCVLTPGVAVGVIGAIEPNQGRPQSISVEIVESFSTSAPFSFSGISLVVGVRPTAKFVKATQFLK